MRFSKVRNVKTPDRGTPGSAGLDFFVPNDYGSKVINPGGSALVPSGIRVNVPKGFALIAFNKSGVATKKSLVIGACVIDEDYQGEIHIHVINVGNENQLIQSGDKLAQFICLPINYVDVEQVDEASLYSEVSSRGSGGFGSTGNK